MSKKTIKIYNVIDNNMPTDIKLTMDRISKVFSKKYNNIIKDRNCQEARVKLTNTQLIKLKTSAKNKAGTILR